MRSERSNPALRGAVVAVLALAATPAAAQTSSQTVQVLEIAYTPTSTNSALDLRPGSYLLLLRGSAPGPYTGALRGPNNEALATDVPVTATGCSSALTGTTRLTTTTFPGKLHLNQLGVSVTVGTGCVLAFSLESLGLSNLVADLDPVPMACPHTTVPVDPKRALADQRNVPKTANGGAQCSEVPWPPETFVADLAPTAGLGFAGQFVPWRRTVTVTASQAQSRSNGRCFYPWTLDVRNLGDGASTATSAAILVGLPFDLQAGSASVPAIPAGTAAPTGGTIGLPQGRWRIHARIDPANLTPESNGGNNVDWITVEVVGRCTP